MNQEKLLLSTSAASTISWLPVVSVNAMYTVRSTPTDSIEQIKDNELKGIILTRGPNSVYEEGAATCSKELFEMGVPVLGLCYGAQLMSHVLGGHVCKAPVREYGKIEVIRTRQQAFQEMYPRRRSAG